MKNYKKITVFLNEDLTKEMNQLLDYRNAMTLVFGKEKKPTNMEEFVTGCVVHYLKEIKNLKSLAGYDDLGKPFRLKNRLKEYLKERGMMQKDLAELTDIDKANISIILSNRSQPSLDYFLRIWIALGCPSMDKILYREKVD